MNTSKNTSYVLWLILGTAFFIKILYLQFSKQSPFYEPLLLDPAYYHEWALKIVSGDFGHGVFYGLPLYPFFLALCYKIFDGSIFAVKLIQAILGLGTIFFIFKSAERISNQRTALLASALAAFYGPLFFHESILIPETLSLPLYAAGFYLACIFYDKRDLRSALLLGVTAGFAVLTKAGIILFIVLFAIVTSFPQSFGALPALPAGQAGGRQARLKHSRMTGLGIVFLLLSFFGTLLPVTLHNLVHGKDLVFLTSHGGFNFYIGNNPKAEGVFFAPEGTGSNVDTQIEDSRNIAEREEGRELKPSEVSRYWSKKAWNFILSDPGRFLWLCGRKLILFFDSREISDVEDYAFSKKFNPLLKGPWLDFTVLGPLVLVGFLAGIRNKNLKYRPVIYLWTGSYLAGVISFFINARYRLPLLGIFFPVAAFAITDLYERLAKKDWTKVVLCGIFLALGIGVTQAHLVNTNFVRDYVNAGDAYQEKKDLDRALALYQKALEIDPEAPKALLATAIVYTKTGRHDEAREYYLKTLAVDPDNATAYNNLGMWYDRRNDLERSGECFRKAIAIKPSFSQAHNNLGMTYGKLKENEKALEEFDIALKLNPNNPRAYTNKGLVLHRLGRHEEAVDSWKKALAINPDLEEARRALQVFGS